MMVLLRYLKSSTFEHVLKVSRTSSGRTKGPFRKKCSPPKNDAEREREQSKCCVWTGEEQLLSCASLIGNNMTADVSREKNKMPATKKNI